MISRRQLLKRRTADFWNKPTVTTSSGGRE